MSLVELKHAEFKTLGGNSLSFVQRIYIYVKEFLLQNCLQCNHLETNCNSVGE